MSDPPIVVAIGEVLWDVYSDGSRLGGALSNVSVHAASFGAQSFLVSRVGQDEKGKEALSRLADLGVDVAHVQQDAIRPTGVVNVSLSSGEPTFEIVEGAAWDAITWTRELENLAGRTDALCFGTLAQREASSRETIQQFLGSVPDKCIRVLDLNFRQHYHNRSTVRTALCFTDLLKLNQDEVATLRQYLGGVGDDRLFLWEIRERFEIDTVVLTLGGEGCQVFSREGENRVTSTPRDVVDAVGAGDAFTAAFLMNLLAGVETKRCAERANEVGGFVVTQNGGSPELPQYLRDAVDQ